jgi:hypothetical protein
MPHYYFDIKDGHSLVDPSGSEFNNNDDVTIAKAKVIAIGVSIDKPQREGYSWHLNSNATPGI